MPHHLRNVAVLIACLFCLFCLVGCDGANQDRPILILAAASTAGATREVAAEFTKDTGTPVEVSAAASNALAQQAIAGSAGDVFLSASDEWARAIGDEGLAVETTPLLTNRLVLIVPRGNPAGVGGPADLAGVEWVALAGENVPAGRYAAAALRAAGVYDDLVGRGRVVRGTDVRQALAYVAAGEADAGVVYATDAAADDDVSVVHEFPADAGEPVSYPLVLLTERGRPVYDFLRSEPAAAIFRRHGFGLAGGSP